MARAAGFVHLAAATGSTSEAAVRRLLDLPEGALIDMGDFVGGTLKYLRRHPVPRLTLAGGFAKIAKLAAGHLDLHSRESQVDAARLAAELGGLGCPAAIVEAARRATSAGAILELADSAGGNFRTRLAERVALDARAVALATLAGGVAVDVAVFDRHGTLLGRAGP